MNRPTPTYRTTDSTTCGTAAPRTIGRDEMTGHINAGRARRLTHAVCGVVFTAALLSDTWYAVMIDEGDAYQKVSEPLAALLTVLDATAGTPSHQPRWPHHAATRHTGSLKAG